MARARLWHKSRGINNTFKSSNQARIIGDSGGDGLIKRKNIYHILHISVHAPRIPPQIFTGKNYKLRSLSPRREDGNYPPCLCAYLWGNRACVCLQRRERISGSAGEGRIPNLNPPLQFPCPPPDTRYLTIWEINVAFFWREFDFSFHFAKKLLKLNYLFSWGNTVMEGAFFDRIN